MSVGTFGKFQLFETFLEVRLQTVVIEILYGEGIESDIHVHREEKGSDLFAGRIGKKSNTECVGSALIVARRQLIRIAEQTEETSHGENGFISCRRNEEFSIIRGK